jgi:valyl-tRNA synthetase
MELPKNYNPSEAEEKWQKAWIEQGIFKFDEESDKPVFSIDTPPPTVSGKMHLGHAFSFSQQDFVARYKRMTGHNVFQPFGTDDNGLATERLIENMKKVKATKMDRDEFNKLCLSTLESDLRPEYVHDWKRIGMSCDWDIFYTTISPESRKISQKYFLDLVKKGRAYRNFSPVIFCPHCKTSIAQVEMEDVEKETTLNYIKGKMPDGSFIIYATTRPELHPACVGISINEEGKYVKVKRDNGETWIISKDAVEKMQEEFPMTVLEEFIGKDIIGKEVKIEFAANKVYVSHDESAQTEYGTGIVYYCTYGGLDCVEWMARHRDVEPVHIMDESGTYNELSPYKGMSSEEARKQILIDLDEKNLLIKKEKMKHSANVHERCGTPIEYVALEQWFIKYLDLKDEFMKRGNELNWYPHHMKNRYDNWVKGLQWDWCVSRQRFSGVPLPIWYDKKTGEPIFPKEDELPVDPIKDLPKGYTAEQVVPEKDIMDTWATSSLTPQLAADRYRGKPIYDKIYPMSLRPQAHDIITFWLFNTVVRSHMHNNSLPWKDTMISGWALDPKGKKMSKSKGNVVHPQEIMEKFGADAMRFWAAGAKLGEDVPFQEKDIVTGKKTVTKLWNASKFVLMHLEDYKQDTKFEKEISELEVMDRWILSKINHIIKSSTESFEKYEYSRTKQDLENFFWNTFCDNYLEVCKDRLYNPDVRGDDARHSAQYSAYTTLLAVLKMFAPIMPHITEEIYGLYFSEAEGKKSIHISDWPKVDEKMISEDIEKMGDVFINVVGAVRKHKSEKSLSLKAELEKIIVKSPVDLSSATEDLKAVTKAKAIVFEDGEEVSVTIP